MRPSPKEILDAQIRYTAILRTFLGRLASRGKSTMTPADLKSWRTERGLKSEQLAEMLGVSRAAVSRWENGRHAIPRSVELALKELERATTQKQP